MKVKSVLMIDIYKVVGAIIIGDGKVLTLQAPHATVHSSLVAED